jgi:hypothetical protein
MKNNIIILTVFTLLVISQTAFSRGSPPPVKQPPKVELPQPSPSEHYGVQFYPVRNYTEEEKEVLRVSQKLANDLFQSQCFETFMVNRKLIDTNGKTPIEVVKNLKTKNLTVPVEMYSAWYSKVIGYRQPPKPDVYTNRKYHAGATACSRGSNLTHEWSHSAGYSHSYSSTPTRPFSVPYSINAAFTACCVCEKNSIKKCSIK